MHKKTIIDFKQLGKRHIFTNPVKELKTRKLSEVLPLLKEVDDYQKQGYYVVGYVSYEAAPAFEPAFQVHSSCLLEEYLLYFTVHDQVDYEEIPICYEASKPSDQWQELTDKTAYRQAIEHIHHHIRQGNTYQVNYTVQLKQNMADSDPLALYNQLVVEQEAAYNAYIAHDDTVILSISPELFFQLKDDQLTTRPMKGTIHRGLDSSSDLANAHWLSQDGKNRSENMMIVDLLRNDMNRISIAGSERVEQLCHVEQYSTVWQMTSTISTRLAKNTTLSHIFHSLFPCGSITGAPKISTMHIIKEVEERARGVYCGAIGICLPYQDAIFNVAIRTLQLNQNTAIYGVGGGITWQSKWQEEYEETKQKAAVLTRKTPRFQLITTGKIHRKQLTFWEKHLARLKEAARYFAYPFDQGQLEQKLLEACHPLKEDQNYRCKIILFKDGNIQIDISILTPLQSKPQQAKLTLQTQSLQQPFVYFKTSHRPHLASTSESIFYNQEQQLLETTIGNLVLELDGQYYTPPVELGILNGIYRQHLLQTGKVQEKILTLEDLYQAENIYACNAVRGLYPLETLD